MRWCHARKYACLLLKDVLLWYEQIDMFAACAQGISSEPYGITLDYVAAVDLSICEF